VAWESGWVAEVSGGWVPLVGWQGACLAMGGRACSECREKPWGGDVAVGRLLSHGGAFHPSFNTVSSIAPPPSNQ